MNIKSKLFKQVIETVNDAQYTSGCHQRCVEILKKLYRENDLELFLEPFRRCVYKIMQCDFKTENLYCERSVDFVALFLAAIEKEETSEEKPFTDLIMNIIEYLHKGLNCARDSARYRSCQIIAKVFNHLLNADISVDICSIVEKYLLIACTDSITSVRVAALRALSPLQDAGNKDCPVIKRLLLHMCKDPQAKVRQECIRRICLRKEVIPYFVNVSRDVNFKVRLTAFERASKSPKSFKIAYKHLLLRNGFRDTSVQVKKYVGEVLCLEWFKFYDYDYLQLIDALLLDSDWKILGETLFIVENVLNAVFEKKSKVEIMETVTFDEKCLLQFNDLNWKSIMYWRFLLRYLRKIGDESENCFPGFIEFCQYIFKYFELKSKELLSDWEYLEYQFILQQLFLMIKEYDVSDTMCKQVLNETIYNIFKHGQLDTEVTDVIVSNLHQTIPDLNEEIKFVCNLISELMYKSSHEEKLIENDIDLNSKVELEKLRMQRNCLREQMEDYIKEREFLKAEECNQELMKLNDTLEGKTAKNSINESPEMVPTTNPDSVLKYLDIANALLASSRILKLSPMLSELKEKVIQNQMTQENFKIMYRAWKGFALCCFIDEKCAKKGMPLFTAPIYAKKDGDQCPKKMLQLAIITVRVLIMKFGTSMFAQPSEEEENLSDSLGEEHQKIFRGGLSITELVKSLVDMLDDEDTDLQYTAGEMLCCLIIFRRIQSPQVISRLVLKWSNPASDDEASSRLRSIIGTSLQKFPKISSLGPQFEEAIPIIIKTIVKAPPTSPFSDINVDNLAKFLIEHSKSFSEAEEIQLNLALRLSTLILQKPGSKICLPYSKMLLLLEVTDSNQSILKEVSMVCEEIKELNTYLKQVLTNITKFQAKITLLLSNEPSLMEQSDINESSYIEE